MGAITGQSQGHAWMTPPKHPGTPTSPHYAATTGAVRTWSRAAANQVHCSFPHQKAIPSMWTSSVLCPSPVRDSFIYERSAEGHTMRAGGAAGENPAERSTGAHSAADEQWANGPHGRGAYLRKDAQSLFTFLHLLNGAQCSTGLKGLHAIYYLRLYRRLQGGTRAEDRGRAARPCAFPGPQRARTAAASTPPATWPRCRAGTPPHGCALLILHAAKIDSPVCRFPQYFPSSFLCRYLPRQSFPKCCSADISQPCISFCMSSRIILVIL